MAKDRKSKARMMGVVVGVSAGVITGVTVALALALGSPAPTHDEHDVIYPSDVHSDMEVTEPPAP